VDFKGAKKYILKRLDDELEANLHYHGVHHTLDVYEVSIKLSELENLSQEEKIIINTAALYHDAGFLFQYDDNEVLAVELVNEVLPSFNFSEKQIKEIGKIILSTQLTARPFTILEKIMSDADYDYLGRDDVKDVANSLHKELNEQGNVFSEAEWNAMQLKFLKKHEYYTESALILRRKKKLEYYDYIKGLK